MNKDDILKEHDANEFEDNDLREIGENAETDEEATEAYLLGIKKDCRDESMYEDECESVGLDQDQALEHTPFFRAEPLPYGLLGKVLLPALTAAGIAIVAYVFIHVLGALEDFHADLYYMIGGVAFTVLSQTFIIIGIRDLANQKVDRELRVNLLPYIINAIVWLGIFGVSVYSAIRSAISIYKTAVSLAGMLPVSAEFVTFYKAVPALVLAAFALFQAIVFILISKELHRR
jgi:hypothetical protein